MNNFNNKTIESLIFRNFFEEVSTNIEEIFYPSDYDKIEENIKEPIEFIWWEIKNNIFNNIMYNDK